MSFAIPKKDDIGLTSIIKKGITDSEGKFTESSECYPYMGFSVDKEGYYQSGDGYEYKTRSKLLDRWEPWNPTIEVVLKKKRNPVPMYIKGGKSTPIPIFNQPLGYDLAKGDWVSPHGEGIISDFIFNCKFERVDFDNAETSCNLSFSNSLDSIQEYTFDSKDQSLYRWPLEAPKVNYSKLLYKWMTVHFPNEGYKSNIDNKINYIFRVRSKLNENGNIIFANYGKIKGDFLVSRKGKIKFYYFFNPDGTRNLEENPKLNLFHNN